MSKIIWDDSAAVNIQDTSGVAEKILSARGLDDSSIQEFINPDFNNHLGSPFDIPGMKKAVTNIKKALKSENKIVIYGDYDIDGISAASLLYDYLIACGSKPDIFIPDRFEEGYGLNSKALKTLYKNGAELVISVDCGTTAHKQISEAKKMGLQIIVTDHHDPGEGAPADAVACVNPKLGKDERLSNLAGVGVAFYLVRALQEKYGFISEGQEKWLLDLVALGTVCDVVPLTGDNRVLVKYGLQVLRKTRRHGLQELIEICGIDKDKVSEVDLGFKIGPRLNAAGRLEHAKKALDLLTADNKDGAKDHAIYLNNLNITRREETNNVYEEANKAAAKYKRDPLVVLGAKGWSQGIVGIVASRVSEKWHKPAIIMEDCGEYFKGSARSYNDFNIIEAIKTCSDILDSYGGHSFAAGVKLQPDRIDEFRFRLNKYAMENMDPENNFKKIDIAMNLNKVSPSIELYDSITLLSPFGNSNNSPIASANYTVEEVRYIGEERNHLRLVLIDEYGAKHTAIGFGMTDKYKWIDQGQEIEMAFEIKDNFWNNTRSHQLSIIDIRKKNK